MKLQDRKLQDMKMTDKMTAGREVARVTWKPTHCYRRHSQHTDYRRRHSTETALLRIMNDALMAADKGMVTIVVLLDYSAAFDTVDHLL